ncbi:metallophosphoesterase [Thomasclavelia spiroformis]|uniref:metallophosphoesterase n=1 Tax=Thomasclavelia spiroformis TaxID=29348 RepID=UPI00399B5880
MKYIIKKQDKIKLRLLFIIIIPIFISGSILTYGYMNIKDIRKTEYTIYTDKKLNKEFKLTMISDLHYPCSTDKKELLEIVNKIENENSDAIILNGDIIDEYTTDSEKKEVFQTLGIKCTLCQGQLN